MPLRPIGLEELQVFGKGANRPVGVAVARDGRVFASDRGTAISIIRPNGTLKRIGLAGGVPCGLAIDRKGRVLIGNFGVETGAAGPLQRLDVDTGQIETLVSSINGRTLAACRHPLVTSNGTIFCTHGTWGSTVKEVTKDKPKDGFVFRLDPDGTLRVVIRDLKFANGCTFDAGETHFFVVQSLAGQVLRYPRRLDGEFGEPKPYGPQLGTIPDEPLSPQLLGGLSPKEKSRLGYADGCAFDQEGNLWVALPMANRVVAITPNFSVTVVLNDPEGKILRMPTALAFGGPDMCDLYVGMIGADHIVKTRSAIPGLPLSHQR